MVTPGVAFLWWALFPINLGRAQSSFLIYPAIAGFALGGIQNQIDPDFRQDDRRDYRYSYSLAGGFVRACPEFNSGMTTTISVILNLIQNQIDSVRQLADSSG